MTLASPFVRRLLFAVVILAGFTLRIYHLDAYGFSEDESAKVRAIAAYARGDFSANAEHPMLMKLLMWGSSAAGDGLEWYGVSAGPEALLRFPNVMAGTLTVALAGALAGLLFSPAAGFVAMGLVAVDPNVIALNRIGKEDTLAVFFFFLAMWCYESAKRIGVCDLSGASRWYTAAGTAFGLMLASKYLPHLLGLYALFNVVYLRDAGPNSPRKGRYYAAMSAAFVAANFAILFPATWRYCLDYLQGRHLLHHGFFYAGRLHMIDGPVSLAGSATTYYFEMIATKVPLPVLVAAAAGFVAMARRRRERGSLWLGVLLFPQLVGVSLAAAKFQRYGLSILVLIDILAAVGVIAAGRWLAAVPVASPAVRRALGAVTALLVLAAPFSAAVAAAPFYSLHQNAIGAHLAPPATLFPEESYDYGIREATREIAQRAGTGATVLTDATGAVTHYLELSGRRDIRIVSLSQHGLEVGGERWVFVQNDHVYAENEAAIVSIRRSERAWRKYRLRNTAVLVVYWLPDRGRGGDSLKTARHAGAASTAGPT
jgi:hypothetical protein